MQKLESLPRKLASILDELGACLRTVPIHRPRAHGINLPCGFWQSLSLGQVISPLYVHSRRLADRVSHPEYRPAALGHSPSQASFVCVPCQVTNILQLPYPVLALATG